MINVIIKDPQKVVFEGEVRSLTSHNRVGKFDVLTDHENFIALIEKYVIIRPKSGQEQYIQVDNGVIKVKGNQIKIYLGIKR